MAVTNFRFFALFVADLLIPVVLLIWFKRKQLQRKHRTIALVLYGLFLIFGQFLVFLPPLPPK